MGRTPRIKKEPFLHRLKKSRHKKRTRRVLMESLSDFSSDEEKEQVSRLLPLELALFTSVLSSKACMQ